MSEPELEAKPPVPEARTARRIFDWQIYCVCNYRCPYCFYAGHWKGIERENRLIPLDVIAASWQRIYDKYGESEVLINGGEPTLYPQFLELLATLDRRHRWFFSTNLWWGLDRWRALAGEVDPSRGRIQMSWHPTEAGDLDRFMEKAASITGLGFAVTVSVVAYPPLLSVLAEHCRKFRAGGFIVTPQPFVGRFDGKDYPQDYTPDERALVRELNRSTQSPLCQVMDYALAVTSTRGLPCAAGYQRCHITRLGDVFRCTQVETCVQNRIGNLYAGFDLLPGATPCPLTHCQAGERT